MASPFWEEFVRSADDIAGTLHHLHNIFDPILSYLVVFTLDYDKGATLNLDISKSTYHTYFISWRMIIYMTISKYV